MSRKKKWAIALAVIIALVGILVTLSFTVFSLKTVQINFLTSHTISLTAEEAVQKGEIGMGRSVFFHSKKGYVERLEKAYPSLEIVNIETVFPNTFVINCAQRQKVYAVESEGGYFICDEDLKVLEKVQTFSSDTDNPILLQNVIVENQNAEAGDFLQVQNYIDIYSALVENNRLLFEQQSIIERVSYSTEYDQNSKRDVFVASVHMFNGQTYRILNADIILNKKMSLLLQVYSQIFSLIGQPIDQSDESLGVWTEELLQNATVEINNYYLDQENCYFSVIKPQESMPNV